MADIEYRSNEIKGAGLIARLNMLEGSQSQSKDGEKKQIKESKDDAT